MFLKPQLYCKNLLGVELRLHHSQIGPRSYFNVPKRFLNPKHAAKFLPTASQAYMTCRLAPRFFKRAKMFFKPKQCLHHLQISPYSSPNDPKLSLNPRLAANFFQLQAKLTSLADEFPHLPKHTKMFIEPQPCCQNSFDVKQRSHHLQISPRRYLTGLLMPQAFVATETKIEAMFY